MILRHALYRIAILTTALCCWGCGPGGDRAGVSGKITLDGQPLPSGSIAFEPIEGTQSPSAGAEIRDGSYAIDRDKGPTSGKFRVKINSQRKTGKKIAAGSPAPPGTLVDETVEAVPARYNKQSQLRAELKAGSNPVHFELTSSAAK